MVSVVLKSKQLMNDQVNSLTLYFSNMLNVLVIASIGSLHFFQNSWFRPIHATKYCKLERGCYGGIISESGNVVCSAFESCRASTSIESAVFYGYGSFAGADCSNIDATY